MTEGTERTSRDTTAVVWRPYAVRVLRALLSPRRVRRYLAWYVTSFYLRGRLPRGLERPLARIERLALGPGLDAVRIDRPIFIVGCHRSGTTVLGEVLSAHPDVAYFTSASDLLPSVSILVNAVCRALGLTREYRERYLQDGVAVSLSTPWEAIATWEYGLPEGEGQAFVLDEHYENLEHARFLATAIRKHLRYFQKARFLNKNPDNSARVLYLNRLFPDAYFIHILRDGRAVCHSLMKARQHSLETFGPNHRHVVQSVPYPGWQDDYRTYETDDAMRAALFWRHTITMLGDAAAAIGPERFLTIRFEDLVEDPQARILDLAASCGLRMDADAIEALGHASRTLEMAGRNDAWRNRDPDEIARVMPVLTPGLRSHGYID
jgi:omega-hydroxy-beta-dihydromenaquinone-9 sulfotransferase